MSTTTQTVQPGDVVLDAQARRLLLRNIYFDTIGESIASAESTDELEAHLKHALDVVALLRAVENALLPAAQVPATVSFVRDVRKEALERIEYEQACHEKYLAGDEDYAAFSTREENLDAHARQVQEVVDDVAACDAFLAEVAG